MPVMSAYMEDNAPDLTAKVSTAWRDFTTVLGEALAGLQPGADLVLILDPTTSGTGNAVYDVALAVTPEGTFRADTTSNATLPESAQLGRSAVGQLVALGWQPPGVLENTPERFGGKSQDGAELAILVVRTMRDVFGAPHPAFLTYDFQAADGKDSGLVLAPARPVIEAAEQQESVVEQEVAVPQSGPLSEVVTTVVSALLHTSPQHLSIDDSGEISVRAGSAMVFIKPTESPAIVDVYSPLLTDIDANERIYREVSELTRRLPIGRLYYADQTIWASVPVYGRDFQPRHLMLAVESMTRLADELDDRLQAKFGGRRFFDQKGTSDATSEVDDTPPMGLYL